MPFPSIEKGCPVCHGNLHFEDTIHHPHRQGYDIHTYRCYDCGPMVRITQISEEACLTRWDVDKYSCTIGEQSPC